MQNYVKINQDQKRKGMNNISTETQGITTLEKCQMKIYEQLYYNNFENLNVIDDFLNKYQN